MAWRLQRARAKRICRTSERRSHAVTLIEQAALASADEAAREAAVAHNEAAYYLLNVRWLLKPTSSAAQNAMNMRCSAGKDLVDCSTFIIEKRLTRSL